MNPILITGSNHPDLHQDKHIVDISKITNEVNYEIQLENEKNTDRKEIKRRFNELWNNIINVVKKRVKIDKNYLQAQCLSKIQDSIENHCNIIPKWLLFTQDVVKEYIIIDQAVISNENESVRLALDPNTIRTHAKDTFTGIL
ncbi:hypothetical protein RhiirC2_773678 [Rhizophagus irregularis]|uniref:Uncharacterized protein n=1 Tax=Rhizophagus irregularis TaxID=588596 RepID=A0A2N1NN96_9GLOM|nr:hypothetical protein RhiirC2_773678 [Rhizophagus irregularis]